MKLKRFTVLLLAFAAALTLVSCGKKNDRIYTCDEIIKAYEAAGYTVWHDEADCGKDGVCYFGVGHGKGNEFYFHVFESAETAETYAKEHDYNAMIWLFSVIYGDPTWVNVEALGNVVIEYEEKEDFKVFQTLSDE